MTERAPLDHVPPDRAPLDNVALEGDFMERVTADHGGIETPIDGLMDAASLQMARSLFEPEQRRARTGPVADAATRSTPGARTTATAHTSAGTHVLDPGTRDAAAADRPARTLDTASGTHGSAAGTREHATRGPAAAPTQPANHTASETEPATAAAERRPAIARPTATPAAIAAAKGHNHKRPQTQNQNQNHGDSDSQNQQTANNNTARRGLDQLATHWLALGNAVIALFLAGAVAAPALLALNLTAIADTLYRAYHLTCHQWAFRSFFLAPGHTSSGLPIAIYSADDLAARGVDPFSTVGDPQLGWKIAICERDLAIYLAVLVLGLIYARTRRLPMLHPVAFLALALPMALDGFTQLFGWRESTWELRVLTGSLFGLGCAWFVLPTLDAILVRGDHTDSDKDVKKTCPSPRHA